jgi:hypothetical protein
VDCGAGRACVAGACRIDPASHWDVVAVGATVPVNQRDGSTWDPLGGLPDPYVRLAFDDTGTHTEGRTPSYSNSTTAVWTETIVRDVRASALLTERFTLDFLDDDLPATPDVIESCTGLALAMASAFDGAPHEARCGTTGRSVFRYRLVRH